MVSPLVSVAAVPILALAACGDAPPGQGPGQGKAAPGPGQGSGQGKAAAHPRRVNGGAIPDGLIRIYACTATLSSSVSEMLRRYVGEAPLSIRLLRADRDADTSWMVLGRLDNSVDRAARPPTPATGRIEDGRTILEWDPHSIRVVARLSWSSPAEDRAAVEFDVSSPSGGGPRELYPYRMRGNCIENPRDWLATQLNGTA
jgi:hypothetical protein